MTITMSKALLFDIVKSIVLVLVIVIFLACHNHFHSKSASHNHSLSPKHSPRPAH